MIERILILGTGLLGSSTGLALRAAGFSGAIQGWDKNPTESAEAVRLGAIDAVASDPLSAAKSSQIILLATPVYAILDWMEQLTPVLSPNQLVTDVGSTKAIITATGNRLFNQPGRAAFLPGHPMAGKEIGGAAAADLRIFRDAAWIFTTDPWIGTLTEREIAPKAASLAMDWMQWVRDFGCRVMELEAERHDELVAWVSHLPQFVSTALSALLEDQVGDAPEIKDVGGRGLREMTRLGASPFSMWRDIAHTNTAQIEDVLLALEQRLAHLRENLKTPALRDEFEQANRFRRE
jgi:prephenate dehydrogenase